MGKKLFTYNENYFHVIDTKEKAYWIGFIMADGYVLDNRNTGGHNTTFRIRLNELDKTHLEKFNKCINCNKPIKIVKNYGVYKNSHDLAEFCIQNKIIVEDLKNIGFSSGNKSCNEFIPDVILSNKDFLKSFILGLFDGDGSIAIGKRLNEFSIVSSKSMCEKIKEFLEEELLINMNKVSRNGKLENLYRVRTNKNSNLIAIRDFLYSNEEIFLERKREAFNKLLPSP